MSSKTKFHFQSRKWCNLPSKALQIINTKLISSHSIKLRLVCKKWQNSVDPPLITRFHPFLPIFLSFDTHRNFDISVRLIPSTILLLRRRLPPPTCSNSKWWLVSVEQFPPNNDLRVYHPLTRADPPWETLEHDAEDIHPNLDFVLLSQGYNMRYTKNDTSLLSQDVPKNRFPSKLILWPEPSLLEGITWEGEIRKPGWSVVMLYSQGNLNCSRVSDRNCLGIYYAEPAEVSGHNEFSKPIHKEIDDIVLWDGVVWAVNRKGKLFWINYQTFKVNACVCCSGISPSDSGIGTKRLLVSRNEYNQSIEDLYLVVCDTKIGYFSVYKINSEFEWKKVKSLGDRILFVGYDHCFFANAEQYLKDMDIPGDCIIFPLKVYPCYNSYRKGPFTLLGPGDYLELGVKIYGKHGSYRGLTNQIANLFWPPPEELFKSEAGGKSRGRSSSNDLRSANKAGIAGMQLKGRVQFGLHARGYLYR